LNFKGYSVLAVEKELHLEGLQIPKKNRFGKTMRVVGTV